MHVSHSRQYSDGWLKFNRNKADSSKIKHTVSAHSASSLWINVWYLASILDTIHWLNVKLENDTDNLQQINVNQNRKIQKFFWAYLCKLFWEIPRISPISQLYFCHMLCPWIMMDYMNYEKAKFQIDDWMRTSIDLGFSGNRWLDLESLKVTESRLHQNWSPA